jgi:hypothetical protein
MAAQTQAASLFSTKRVDHPWLSTLLKMLDERLRSFHGVIEYTCSPECIFRIQLVVSREELVLSHGISVHPGDRMINLHLWNERIPPFPENGPRLAWASRMSRAVELSFRELALYLATRPELDDVGVIRAEQSERLLRLVERYGFKRIAANVKYSLRQRMHQFGENILIAMMIFASNGALLPSDALWRERTLMLLPRASLEQRYGLKHDRAPAKRVAMKWSRSRS